MASRLSSVALFLIASTSAAGVPDTHDTTDTQDAPSAPLSAATACQLDALPPLQLPAISPDLLLFGSSYRFSAGSGSLATAPAELTAAVQGDRGNVPHNPLSGASWSTDCRVDSFCDTFCATDRHATSAYAACAAQWYMHIANRGVTATGRGSAWMMTVPLLVSGAFTQFAEYRDMAYRIDMEGAARLVASGSSRERVFLVEGDLRALHGSAKYYAHPDPAWPLYVAAEVGVQHAAYRWWKLTTQPAQSRYTVPWRAALGVGAGRLYTIEPRLRLLKIERLLRDAAVIDQPLPYAAARHIELAWWALRDELGYAQRLLHTLKILRDSGLLVGDVTPATVYRFGRILGETELVQRRQGHETSLRLLFGQAWDAWPGAPSGSAWGIEARHEHVLNLSYTAAMIFQPSLSVAPRAADRSALTYPADTPTLSALMQARVLLNVPLAYTRYTYDTDYNRTGALSWQTRLAVAFQVAPPDGQGAGATNIMLGGGGDYTFFRDRTLGYTFGADIHAGYAFGHLGYSMGAHIRLCLGHARAYYVAPVPLVDALPFDLQLPAAP